MANAGHAGTVLEKIEKQVARLPKCFAYPRPHNPPVAHGCNVDRCFDHGAPLVAAVVRFPDQRCDLHHSETTCHVIHWPRNP